MLTTVPVIDLTAFGEGAPEKRAAVARAIDTACTDIGFFTIVGHRVPDRLVARMLETSRAFFDLPVPPKQAVARPAPEQSRGYIALGDENLSYSRGDATAADLTNDRWISTMHRVVNPPRETARGNRRLSIPSFFQPNYDAVIECLPGCCGPDNPPRYEPLTSGRHRLTKFLRGVGVATPTARG
ncbi:MAG TPA: 2-oxoglutarate and iron-dependent oxygenase domain-containing protein [Methylomirabilota bacterium]|jgi:isopenicillin N synthase-like dioxygenase|nr:2-oxoglutarate and iron-dependent oxygenase domain-containing protein [Methylomirabilota bacterium]